MNSRNSRTQGYQGNKFQRDINYEDDQDDEPDENVGVCQELADVWIQNPNFTSFYNLHQKRILQDWELEIIFPLGYRGFPALSQVKQALDCGKERSVLVSHMVEKLQQANFIKNVKLPKESIFRTRLNEQRAASTNEFLQALIKVIKQEIQQPIDRSLYQETFYRANYRNQREPNEISVDDLLDWIDQTMKSHNVKQNNDQNWRPKVREYFLTSTNQRVHIIQFVQSLNEIVTDVQHRNISQHSTLSIHHDNLAETISKNLLRKNLLPKSDPLLKKICESLPKDFKAEDLRLEFNIKKQKVVTGGRSEEVEVAAQSQLRAYLQKFSPKVISAQQIEELVKLYTVQSAEHLEKKPFIPKQAAQLPVTVEDQVNEDKEDHEEKKEPQKIEEKDEIQSDELQDEDEFEKDEEGTQKLIEESLDSLKPFRQNPLDRPVENPSEKLREKPDQKEVKRPTDTSSFPKIVKGDSNSRDKSVDKAEDKSQMPEEKPDPKPVQKSAQKQKEKQEIKPIDQPTQQQADSAVDNHLDKPVQADKNSKQEKPEKEIDEWELEELKEGGEQEQLFNFQQFLKDMTAALNDKTVSAEAAERNVYELFEFIKRWKILNGDSFLLTCQRIERKGVLLGKDSLKNLINRIMDPLKLTEEDLKKYLDSLLLAYEQKEPEKLDYFLLYDQFQIYANKKTIKNDPNHYVGQLSLEEVQNLESQVKQMENILQENALRKLLAIDVRKITDQDRLTKKMNPIEQPFQEVFRYFQNQITTPYMRDSFSQCREKLMHLFKLKTYSDKVNIVAIQDMIGYIEEEKPTIIETGNPFRGLSIALHLSVMSIKELKSQFQRQTLPKDKFVRKIFDLLRNNQRMMLKRRDAELIANQCVDKKQPGNVDIEEFFNVTEFEANKLLTLIRFFISLGKQLRRNGEQFTSLSQFFRSRNLDTDLIPKGDFEKLLVDLEIIEDLSQLSDASKQQSDLRFIENEYWDQKTVVSVKEIEDDFDYFVESPQSVLKMIEQVVIEKIIEYGPVIPTIQSLLESSSTNKQQVSIKKTNWVHRFDFVKWFTKDGEDGELQELVHIFLSYMTMNQQENQHLISIPQLLGKLQEHPYLRGTIDESDIQQIKYEGLRLKLVRFVALTLDRNHYNFRNVFEYVRTIQEFLDSLVRRPFLIEQQSWYEYRPVEELLRQYYSNRDYSFNSKALEEDVFYEQKSISTKFEVFERLHKHLDKIATPIETAVKAVKHNAADFRMYGIGPFDFQKLCDIYKFRITTNEIEQILSTFELDTHGEVPCSAFIDDFNQTFYGRGEVKDQVIKAKRFLKKNTLRFKEIADSIVFKRMKDFGSFFKGFDFQKTNFIECKTVFQILQKLMSDVLGEGDILALITSLDPDDRGYVDIRVLADEINFFIKEPEFKVRLETIIDQVVIDDIVQRIDDEMNLTFADANKFQSDAINAPEGYQKVLIDIQCGITLKRFSDLEDLFSCYSQQQPGWICGNEFYQALVRINVDGSMEEIEDIFKYIDQAASGSTQTRKFIPLQEFVQQLIKDRPTNHSLEDLQNELLYRLARHLTEAKIPLHERCKPFLIENKFIDVSNFEVGLMDNLRALEVLTQNMVAMLLHRYNHEQYRSFELTPFLNDLNRMESLNRSSIKIFKTQNQVDEYTLVETLQAQQFNNTYKQTVDPFPEPVFVVRSAKNTYYDISRFDQSYSPDQFRLTNSWSFKLDELVRRTRQRGFTIEGFFQMFGLFSKYDGIRKLNVSQFIEALKAIQNLSWSRTQDEPIQLFNEIKAQSLQTTYFSNIVPIQFDQDLISLEQIGRAVFYTASIDLVEEEANTLLLLHTDLFQTAQIDTVVDLFNFCNFNRDCVVPLVQIINILLGEMKLKKVSRDQLSLLLQRYTVQMPSLILKKQDNKSPASGASLVTDLSGKQSVCYYSLLKDLGYCHRGLGLQDLWVADIAEDLIKSFQSFRCEKNQYVIMEDSQITDHLTKFFIGLFANNFLQIDDFFQVCNFLGFGSGDNQIHSTDRLKDFFYLCGLHSDPAQDYQMNSSQRQVQDQLLSINLQDFIRSLMFFGRKPIVILYQDILDRCYIASKQLDLSVTGPKVMNLFQDVDRKQLGMIQQAAFCQCLKEFVNESYASGRPGGFKVGILSHDITFLSTKYLLAPTQDSEIRFLNYTDFLSDLQKIENEGIGAGHNELSTSNKLQNLEIKHRNQTKLKRLVGDLPAQSQQIYSKMTQFIRKKDLQDVLIIHFINADMDRSGHLQVEQIKQVLSKTGMPLNQKQVVLLTQDCVGTDTQGRFNYLQIIGFLFGEEVADRVRNEQGITLEADLASRARLVQKASFSIDYLQLTSQLQDEIELKLEQINKLIRSISNQDLHVTDQQMINVFSQVNITLGQSDINTIQLFVKHTMDPSNQKIDFNRFVQHFRIGDNSSNLLQEISQKLKHGKIDLEKLTTLKYLKFKDLTDLLAKAKVQLSPQQQVHLQTLFNQMSQKKDEITTQSLIRLLNDSIDNQSLQGPQDANSLPSFVVEFVHHILRNKINLRDRFRQNFASKLISIQDFVKFLMETKFKTTHGVDRVVTYFKDIKEMNQISFKKVVFTIRKIDENYLRRTAGENKELIQTTLNLPQKIRLTLKKITDQLQQQQMSRERFFEKMDQNGDGQVDEAELIDFCTRSNPVQGLNAADVRLLFQFMDSNYDSKISINEISLLIQGYELTQQERLNSFSKQFENLLMREILELFHIIDTDRDGYLQAEELIKFVQPNKAESTFNLKKAYELISQIDSNSNGRIEKQEFCNFVLKRQKQMILEVEGEMEHIRKLYREVASGEQDLTQEEYVNQLMTNGTQLSKRGLRRLIEKIGQVNLQDEELTRVFAEIDVNRNGKVDIDEFMDYVYNADKDKQKHSHDVMFRIRKANAKLNVRELQLMFNPLPLSFTPSFSQVEMEQRNRNTPSSKLMPQFDYAALAFSDFAQIASYNSQPSDAYCGQYAPKTCFQVTFTSEAYNVPLLRKVKSKEEIPHIDCRCVLLDGNTKSYLSSFYIIPLNPTISVDLGRTHSVQSSVNCNFQESLRTFVFTSQDDVLHSNVCLVFEFVAYNTNNTTQQVDDRNTQITVAWASLPVSEMAVKTKHKLQLLGGSPFAEELLEPDDEPQKQVGKQGFLDKLFKSKQQGAFERFITLETKPFSQIAPTQAQADICVLPTGIIVASPLISFAAAFRNYCFEKLQESSQTMKQPNADLIISKFAAIYDNSDTLSVVASCWPVLLANENTSRDSFKQERISMLTKVVKTIYPLMWESWYRQDRSFPLRTLPVGSQAFKVKQHKIKFALLVDNQASATQLKKERETLKVAQAEAFENYTPFNTAELTSDNWQDQQERKYDIFYDQASA